MGKIEYRNLRDCKGCGANVTELHDECWNCDRHINWKLSEDKW